MKWALRVVRKLLGIPGSQITRGDALAIALAETKKRGTQPGKLSVHEGLRTWTVWIDSERVGSPFVVIENRDGIVLRWVSLPR
jgi:hypothetical protein